ncbi:MAG: DUF58 domain-containing protein [Planctomycetes bacterium]|nr:DUF58 domain-containing protein [Planctomycetota bacterium]MCB9902989.1 DUF58 domain-containing protein [Planctomycetota bacterium]
MPETSARRPSQDSVAEATLWKLGWVPSPPHGRAGDALTRGTGSSIEFQDHRVYAPGDDVRHLDWRAYARTGELTVKLYSQELLPRLDLLFDASRSMTVDDAKVGTALDLTSFFAGIATRQGFAVRVIELGDAPRVRELDEFRENGSEFAGRLPLSSTLEQATGLLRPGTLRLLIGDFLSPHDPAQLVRGLAARAGGLALFQVLSRDDAAPPVGVAFRLQDAETGEAREIVLGQAVVDDYLDRLKRLTGALETECRRAAARFTRVVSGPSLRELTRDVLAREGLVVPG